MPIGTIPKAMDPDRQPDPEPWLTLFRLLTDLTSSDVREQFAAWLQEVINRDDTVIGHLAVIQQDQTIDAHGTVENDRRVGRHPYVSADIGPLAWRPDLLIAAVVILVILLFHDRSFDEALAELLRELCRIYVEFALGTAFLRRQ